MGGAFSAVVGMGSSIYQAKTASDAAEQQAEALKSGQKSIEMAALRARNDVLDTLTPAMQDYGNQLANARDMLVRGDSDVMQILQQSTGAADQILAKSGADVQKLILGAEATSRGMPREMFDRQYQAGQVPGQTAPQMPGQPAPQIAPTATPTTTPLGATTPITDRVDRAVNVEGQPGIAATGAGGADPGVFQGVPLGAVADPVTGQQLIQQPERQAVSGVPGTGYLQARADLVGSRDISRAGIEAGRTGALGQLARGEEILTDAEGRAIDRTSTFSDAGRQAAEREAAMSGAYGPEAQQAAMDEFMESPGQKFLRERQEKALLRGSSATGGLGGGRVLTALQEQAMGIAATQQQQQLANLGTIAQRGAGVAQGEQSLIGQMGAGRAGFAGQAADVETGVAKDLANIEALYGPQMAQYAMQTGLQLADVQQMTDQQRAGLVQNLGSGLAGVRAGTLSDLGGLAQNYGTMGINQANVQAQLLANIGTRTGSQVGQYQALQGAAQSAGTLAAGQTLGSGIAAAGSGLGKAYEEYRAGQVQPQQVATPQPAQPVYQARLPVSTYGGR